ncbi:hypothetical protein MUO98_01060 [Candidatus Bathyarchaeota archaeon]|nr:hypothetical protein [Candidatus Bathyarchaeota archaeon]
MPHLKLIGALFRRFDVEYVGGVSLLATGPVKIADVLGDRCCPLHTGDIIGL